MAVQKQKQHKRNIDLRLSSFRAYDSNHWFVLVQLMQDVLLDLVDIAAGRCVPPSTPGCSRVPQAKHLQAPMSVDFYLFIYLFNYLFICSKQNKTALLKLGRVASIEPG